MFFKNKENPRKQREQVLDFVLAEVYGQYLKFKSSLEFLRFNNASILNSDDNKREELNELRSKKIDEEGKSEEDIKEETKKIAIEIHRLESEIDYKDKIESKIEKTLENLNETAFHYNYLLKLKDSKVTDFPAEKLEK